MSNFLMVVPEGWLEVPDGQAFVDKYTEATIFDLLNSNQMGGIDAFLGDEGLVPEGMYAEDARFFKDAGAYRVWYKLTFI